MAHPYNLLDPQVIANPYPVYQRLRAEQYFLVKDGFKGWYERVTKMIDVGHGT